MPAGLPHGPGAGWREAASPGCTAPAGLGRPPRCPEERSRVPGGCGLSYEPLTLNNRPEEGTSYPEKCLFPSPRQTPRTSPRHTLYRLPQHPQAPSALMARPPPYAAVQDSPVVLVPILIRNRTPCCPLFFS